MASSSRAIRYVIGTGATQDSVGLLPTNAIVTDTRIKITTPYSVGATITVGQAGSLTLFQETADNNPQAPAGDIFAKLQDTAATNLVVRTTIAGAPAAGAAVVIVGYV